MHQQQLHVHVIGCRASGGDEGFIYNNGNFIAIWDTAVTVPTAFPFRALSPETTIQHFEKISFLNRFWFSSNELSSL